MIGGIIMKSDRDILYFIKQVALYILVIISAASLIIGVIYLVHYLKAPIGSNTLSLPYDTVAKYDYEFKVMNETPEMGQPWEYYTDTLLYDSYKDKVKYTWDKQILSYTELEDGHRRYRKIIKPDKWLYPILSVELISYEESPIESFVGAPFEMPFGKVVIQIEKW